MARMGRAHLDTIILQLFLDIGRGLPQLFHDATVLCRRYDGNPEGVCVILIRLGNMCSHFVVLQHPEEKNQHVGMTHLLKGFGR